MLMVQRRKRTQFTQKFKEHLEKVEGIIQEAIYSLPEADAEGKGFFNFTFFSHILSVKPSRPF